MMSCLFRKSGCTTKPPTQMVSVRNEGTGMSSESRSAQGRNKGQGIKIEFKLGDINTKGSKKSHKCGGSIKLQNFWANFIYILTERHWLSLAFTYMLYVTHDLGRHEVFFEHSMKLVYLQEKYGEWNGNPLQSLAWRILWAEEPGRLLSMGLHRVGHDWSDLTCMHALEKEMASHSNILAWRIPGMEEPGGPPSMGSQQSQTRLKRLSSSRSRRNKEGRIWDYFKLRILNCILNFHSHFSCSVIWGHLDLSSLSTASYSLSSWNRWYQSIHCQTRCLYRIECEECSKTQCLRNDCMFFDSGITEQKGGFSGRKLQLP